MAELERRRAQAHAAAAALRERATARQPRLREIEAAPCRGRPSSCQGGARRRRRGRGGGTDQRGKSVAAGGDGVPAAGPGETAVDFEPVYTCPRCRDTGYAGGKICGCLEQKRRGGARPRRPSPTTNMWPRRVEERGGGTHPNVNYPGLGFPGEDEGGAGLLPMLRRGFRPGRTEPAAAGPDRDGENPCLPLPLHGGRKRVFGGLRAGAAAAAPA